MQRPSKRNDGPSPFASPFVAWRRNNSPGVLSLEPGTMALLLSRRIPPAQHPQAWPHGVPEFADVPVIAQLCDQLNAALRASGSVVVRMASDLAETSHALTEAAWNLFTCLADPLPHSAAGELLYEVAVTRSTPPPHRYYSQSNTGGDIHTDATYIHREPPLYVGLLCLQPALSGGESILVDGRRIYAALHERHPSALDWLRREYHFDCAGQRGVVEATVRRHVFEIRNGFFRVQYLRSYIVSGHARAGEPLAAEAVASFDVLDGFLADPAFQRVHRLSTGDLLLLDNHTMLHGRTAFTDHEDFERRRRLIRLWGQPRAARTEMP